VHAIGGRTLCALRVSRGAIMEEFIFGTFATDQLKLMHHRASLSGVQHQHMLVPADPLPGQSITVRVRTGSTLTVDQVVCYYTTDGTLPSGSHGVALNGSTLHLHQINAEWDTLVWGYSLLWEGEIPSQPEGTLLRYQIGAWAEQGPEHFADWPQVKAASEKAAAAYFRGESVPDVLIGDPQIPFTFSRRPPDTFHVLGIGGSLCPSAMGAGGNHLSHLCRSFLSGAGGCKLTI